MKKFALALMIVLFVLNMLFAAMDYWAVDPLSLPTYTGSLSSAVKTKGGCTKFKCAIFLKKQFVTLDKE